MIKIDVFIQNKNWKKYISNPSRYIKSKAKLINSSLKFIKNKKINFSILLAGNKEIKKLNKKFRKKDKTTDVLSFPFYKNIMQRDWRMDVNFRYDRLKKNHPAFKLDNIGYLKALYDLMKPRVMSLAIFTCVVGFLIAPFKNVD